MSAILLAAQMPHLLGWSSWLPIIIPIGDAIIVLRRGGPRATAYGVHATTAAAVLITAALLFT